MGTRIIQINPLTSSLWMDFVARNPRSTIFHHPLWMLVLHKQYNYAPLAYCLVNEKEVIKSGIPFFIVGARHVMPLSTHKRLISLPFTDHCFPLYDYEDDLKSLLHYLLKCPFQNNGGLDQIEIRSFIPEISNAEHPDRQSSIQQHDNLVWHTLKTTPDIDIIFNNVKKQTQQCVRKAEREGVTVRIDRSKAGIEMFYNLQVKTRRRLGVPVQPKGFFDLLWKLLIKNNMGFVMLAFAENVPVPISGSVFLHYKSTVIYKYSASDSNYWNLRANNLLLWKAIEWACLNGYKLFDFGKSEILNTGLCKFKSSWGSIEEPLPYSIISSGNIEMPRSANKDNTILSKLTVKIIQNTPSFVCRTTGELLYKYFG